MSENGFTKFEKKSVSALSAVLALRMVGLFLILPVLALHATELTNATPFLIGVALGVYGLTQALLQVPFGAASDRWGRKPVITLGLIIFAIGSIIAAESNSIYGIIAGRALQGGGAIAAVVLAFVGDLTRENQRTKAMAIMGVTIGFAFTISLMLGPLLDNWAGIRGLFWIACAMAVAGLLLVWLVVPREESFISHGSSSGSVSGFRQIIANKDLLRLYAGTLTIHTVLTSLFLAFPTKLVEVSEFTRSDTWKVFVPVLLLSFLAMIPFIRMSSRKNRSHVMMITAALMLLAAQFSLFAGAGSQSVGFLIFGLWLFFVGFNILEAIFPSTTIGSAPHNMRGAAMGVFNTCTFSGAFIGGVLGGIVYGSYGSSGVFVFSGIAILLWIAVAFIFRPTES